MAIQAVAFPKNTQRFDPTFGVRLTLDRPCLRIGRAPNCDLRLPDLGVSPHHATLTRRADGFALCDEDSAQGTWVAGVSSGPMVPLAPRNPLPIVGPVLTRFGPFYVLLDPRSPGPPDPARAGRVFTVELLARSLQERGRFPYPTLYVLDGPDLGTSLDLRALRGAPHLVGRGNVADLRLRDGYTSRKHFEIMCERNVWVRDVGSSGGTMLGGQLLEPMLPTRWNYGTLLCAGRNVFTYEYPLTETLEGLDHGGKLLDSLAPSPVEAPPSPSARAEAVNTDGEQEALGAAPRASERGPIESTIRPKTYDA